MESKDNPKPKRGYWYEYFHSECVLCGSHHDDKYRVYDRPKPEDPTKCHHFEQYACDYHFL